MKILLTIICLTLLLGCDDDERTPSINLATDTSTVNQQGSFTLTATVSKPKNATRVEFYRDDEKIYESTTPPFSTEITVTFADNGKHEYSARVFDKDNESNESNIVEVVVDIPVEFISMGNTFLDENIDKDAFVPTVGVNATDNPIVIFAEHDGTSYNAYVKKWNGTSWQQMGDTFLDANENQNTGCPTLAVDVNGNPIATWIENDGTSFNIYVKKWNGSNWIQLGNFLDMHTDTQAFIPSIAIDSQGNPIVAWYEQDGTSFNTYVKKWNGTEWQLMGDGALDINLNQNTGYTALATDSSGNPVIVWEESDGTSVNIYVKKWNGDAWDLIGDTFVDANENQNALHPAVAIGSDGNPVVSWDETDGTSTNIYVKKWNGTAWESVGNNFLDINENKNSGHPSVSIDNQGNPLVSWFEQDDTTDSVYVKRWNGTSWTQLGNYSLDIYQNQHGRFPAMATDSTNNTYVVWSESDGKSFNIFVKHYSE